jgi:hypothetical protein
LANADWIVLAACIGLVWWLPSLNAPVLSSIEQRFIQFARNRWISLAAVGVFAILARVALLPWMPVPQPRTHDEFSYLLAGDTFTHGRLANPQHPYWIFFDTFHVIQHPTYASIYPPAQGFVLAIGKLLGNPWIGVVVSTAAMCVALTWMLQQWMPARWALFGGVLVLLRYGIFSYWMNSYWGGSVAAAGAALVMGAFPRILKSRHLRDVLIFGAGIALLATSRPLEGFIFCVPVVSALLWWCLRGTAPTQTARTRNVLLSLASILLCLGGFIAYYNWRVTKNPLEFPYSIEQEDYLTTPVFVWQDAKPPLTYANRQFEDFYNGWLRGLYSTSWNGARKNMADNALEFWEFFLGPAFSIPFLMLPWLLRDRKMRLSLIQFGLSSIGLLAVVWFHPHYAAPLLATIMLLLVQALRHLRTLRIHERRIGIALVRLIVLFSIFMGPASFLIERSNVFYRFWLPSAEWLPARHILAVLVVVLVLALFGMMRNRAANIALPGSMRFAHWQVFFMVLLVWQICIEQQIVHPSNFPHIERDLPPSRATIEQRFTTLPGEHLVLVRYSFPHDIQEEYVYNSADIDHAKIVWAREIPGRDLSPLLTYFRNREVWVLEPDEHPQRLYPYASGQPAP